MLTPIDEAYATCERTYVRLHIYSGEISPEEISDQLELDPSSLVKKGLALRTLWAGPELAR